jgi:FixJ family two-component response regulator
VAAQFDRIVTMFWHTAGWRLPAMTVDWVAIVDDDAAMLKSMERLLQAHAYATSGFTSAEEFLASGVADRAIGAVLDIHLPGMSGIDALRHLRAAGSRLPVVFITAFHEDVTRADAFALGCVDYLEKPFEANRLTEALERGRKS